MTPYYEEDGITIYHADCREILPGLLFDFVVTDPPYGLGGRRRKRPGQGRGLAHSSVKEDWDDGDLGWLALVPTSPILTFWPGQQTGSLLDAARATGRDRAQLLVWSKPDPMPVPDRFVQLSIEPVWCLFVGSLPLSGGIDLFRCSSVKHSVGGEGHPYEKPLKVMRWLVGLTRSEILLDPFMGSGTTLRAAKDLGRRAIGIERSERYCEIAVQRLAQGVLALESE